ncbi:AbrB family transcriptional regulator [Advenella sp. RU8]|uniref:AbrB family transcriptional regulator n=1 Tax=Advenella alkanexedens TaxID=1481665 RepID=A0ABS6NQF0_9BURK|nr:MULTISPECIES: AbrB family transcriptional regulator [Advenella]MBV4397867.1 AbrB family transcriptional regulator [Advenella alkanexedens]NLN66905.1 AbrB family transcriptional regulator [Alcaligenaceae bacterium]
MISQSPVPLILAYPLAIVSGYVFYRVGVPLPWMVGSIFCIAGLSIFVGPVRVWSWGRRLGLGIVGTCLGLYFTPSALERLLDNMGWILLAVVISYLFAAAASLLLAKMAKLDRSTAFLSSIPGGAAEMSMLGQRFGAIPEVIAVSQLLRIVLLVSVLPSLLLVDGSVVVKSAHIVTGKEWFVLGLLLCSSILVTAWLARMGMMNAWLLVPLAIGMVVSVSGLYTSPPPGFLTAVAQVLIGVHMGAMFRRDSLLMVRRTLPNLLLNVFLITGMCALIGAAIALGTGTTVPTMILATAPGGIADMSLSAKTLGLDVPTVVGFHVVRVFVFLSITPYLFFFLQRLGVLKLVPSGR